MHPNPTVVTFRPVLPKVLESSLAAEFAGAALEFWNGSKRPAERAPANGNIKPAERNSRRDDCGPIDVSPLEN
jgi:hypothetical protein